MSSEMKLSSGLWDSVIYVVHFGLLSEDQALC